MTKRLLADSFVRRHRHRAQARDRENTECSRGMHGLTKMEVESRRLCMKMQERGCDHVRLFGKKLLSWVLD